ncbi:MAG: HAD family phosphatase [Erysipelotrichaceae bacterium]|nr:HAD family phosphatase [Erysipelotrichaceae bacterium]
MVKAIVFDCDGVILDSEPLFTKAFEAQKASYGFPIHMHDKAEVIGTTLRETCRIILEKNPRIDKTLDEFLEEHIRYVYQFLMSDDLEPMDGFVDFVKEQHAKGIKMAVASSSPMEYVLHKLRLFKVEDFFSVIVSGDDISRSKPDPEIYEVAVKKLGLPKEEIIAIEDAYYGIRSAKAAGLYTIGFKGSVLEQDTSEADEEVYRFQDIRILKADDH